MPELHLPAVVTVSPVRLLVLVLVKDNQLWLPRRSLEGQER